MEIPMNQDPIVIVVKETDEAMPKSRWLLHKNKLSEITEWGELPWVTMTPNNFDKFITTLTDSITLN